MEITRVGPEPGADEVRGVHRVLVAAAAADRPGDPAPLVEEVAARLGNRSAQRRMLRWVARDAGRITGYGKLRLPDTDNTHLGRLEVVVDPAARRHGTGTALARAASEAVLADGRRLVIGEADEGSAGEAFCAALGMRLVQRDRMSLLRFADADRAEVQRLAAAPHPGYRLRRWTDHCPEELLERYAAAATAMNDAPSDDVDMTDYVFTPAGIREDEAAQLRVHAELRVVVAVHEDSGDIAGFTEVYVTRRAHRSDQGDTAVVAAHRGHGLGLWMKADMLVRLWAERPAVAELITGNAASNAHMLAVNDRLGYRLWSTLAGYQGAAADVLSRLGTAVPG